MPNSCVVCGHLKGKASNVSMFRIPVDKERRKQWLSALKLTEDKVNENSRVCGRHFVDGSPDSLPTLEVNILPLKNTERAKRATKRAAIRALLPSADVIAYSKRVAPSHHSSNHSSSCESSSVVLSSCNVGTTDDESMSASPGEQYFIDYTTHDLPSIGSDNSDSKSDVEIMARLEMLEAETKHLKVLLNAKPVQPQKFRIEQIASNDSLVHFYTGFCTYALLLSFFEFLGPATSQLNYWGNTKRKTTHKRQKSLSPLNQYFLTLVKLRLNLRTIDLAVRFGISPGVVSKYFITWICFMYHHLKEIDWTPAVEQVAGSLPSAFQEKYPTTYSIIDASEIYIERPSDLFVQGSTWSNYKHHNTAKFLIGCTPNGAVSFISQLYVGSISDVELTKVSGYLDTLKDKRGVSVMADRGFTIRDCLAKHGIDLNLPPFMEGKQQLSSSDVEKGRRIASLRIHVERAIGRIKNYQILKGVFPNTMIRLANQIVSVCAWLTNFQPILVPPPSLSSVEEDIDTYFAQLSTDSDYDADSSDIDED